MKLTVLQSDFAKSLNIASRFVSSRAQIPVLTNIKLSAQPSGLTLQATNLETAISIEQPAKVTTPGEIALPARSVVDLVTNIASQSITLTLDKESLSFEADGFSASLLGTNTADFPTIPTSLNKTFTTLDPSFAESLSEVIFSISTDEARPTLTGLLMSFTEDKLSLVSTNGFRLTKKQIKLQEKIGESVSVIIPRSVITELARLLSTSPQDKSQTLKLDIDKERSEAIFSLANILITSRLIEGQFPDYEKVLQVTPSAKVIVDKSELAGAMKVSSVFSKDTGNIVKLTVGDNQLEISSQSAQSGKQLNKLPAKTEGEKLSVSFNYKYIEEFLSIVGGNEVEISLQDTTKPALFIDPKNTSLSHVIMPINA
jgi:DNA polymerase III subunit beta